MSRGEFDAAFFSMRTIFGPPFALAFRPKLFGAEHLPRIGPALLASNHASFLDPILIGMRVRRPVRFVVSNEFYSRPRLNGLLRWFGTIPVGGSATMIRAYRRITEVIRNGELVGIFPEGGITRDGAMRPFRDGAALIALRTGVPVVPLHVSGTFEALPRHARWPRFVPIALRIGAPIPVNADPHPSLDDVLRLTASIREAVLTLGRSAGG